MLRFAAFVSDIELPFYTALAFHKINHDKLDDSARRLLGLYEVRPMDAPEDSCRLQLHGNALTADVVPNGYCRAEGMIKNVNTIEEYRMIDKASVLDQAARTIWDAINDGSIYSCPSLLATFSIICFADLKKYKFTYLSAFPALHSDPPWRLIASAASAQGHDSGHTDNVIHMDGQETAALADCVQTWRYRVDARQHGFFLAKRLYKIQETFGNADHRSHASSPSHVTDHTLAVPYDRNDTTKRMWDIAPLEDYETGFFDSISSEDSYVCFADPSTYPSYPGWMLRNLLVLIRLRWKLERVQILCYRDTYARREDAKSVILPIEISSADQVISPHTTSLEPFPQLPRVTGWERNVAGKVVSRVANLGEYMDPRRLADQAVDLNLKLMKWRIAPTLNLDKIKSCKCLLLGAGTLGSHVARNLMVSCPHRLKRCFEWSLRVVKGWGVHKITLVDSGSVSFSNPVRQPLFNFQDCVGCETKKAIRAAEALKEIFPGVDATGYPISVPMAGHPVNDLPATRSDYEILDRLFDEHDAVFILMDTRESRWLPSVMGKAKGKIVLNAALGFDSFLVMRHGTHNRSSPNEELGCYFCSDVVAPADTVQSLADRTLDQQCTVTRPGVAAIASALLVEIFVSLLQHPLSVEAAAPANRTDDVGDHPLGIVPHQIRGFLSNFQNIVIKGRSYDCCSACSDRVLRAYEADGWQFVLRALNERGYVEDLCGLREVHIAAEKAFANIVLSEMDEMQDDDGHMI